MIKKKYLKDAGEVTKALNEGKEVFAGTVPYVYKMVNGIICHYDTERNNKLLGINTTICMEYELFIKEQESLKIEVGKFYRTRDGRRAYCFNQEEGGFYNHFVIDGESGWGTYADDGLTLSDEEHPEDIVDYWNE